MIFSPARALPLLLAASVGASPAFAAAVHLRITAQGQRISEITLLAVKSGVRPIQRTATCRALDCSIDLSPGTWIINASVSGSWFAPVSLVVTKSAKVARATLVERKASPVVGRLRSADKKTLGALAVAFRDSGRRDGTTNWDGEANCTLQEDQSFRCEVPTGTQDLRLRTAGYVNSYHWSVSILPNQPTSLGTVDMKPGGSIVGWVVKEAPGGFGRCKLTLEVAPADPGSRPERSFEKLALEAKTDERGFFQFDGLAPGGYLLTAEETPYVSAESRVLVLEGRESRLRQPLRLVYPATARFFVAPQLSAEDSNWTIRLLRRRGGRVTSTKDIEVDSTGTATAKGLAPGDYMLQVLGPGQQPWYSIENWTFEGEAEPLFIAIPLVRLAGDIALEGSPLAGAALTFGGAHGVVRVSLTADDKGRFDGFIPRAGRWVLDVDAPDARLKRHIPSLEVPRPQNGRSVLHIDLPNARVSGRVVTADGDTPFKAAIVSVYPADGPEALAEVEPNDDGTFQFAGLERSRYFVSAVATKAKSQSEPVDLTQVSSEEGVVLRMTNTSMRVVSIVSTQGPVPGAATLVRSMDRPHQGDPMLRAGIDGTVTFDVLPGTRQVSLDVAAQGFAYWFGAVSVANETPQEVLLSQTGGTLVLDLRELSSFEQLSDIVPVLVHDGGYSWPLGLRSWARSSGGNSQDGEALIVPDMAPGVYSLCSLPIAAAPMIGAFAAGGGDPRVCETGLLDSGSELRLRIPR